jgi:hypothetical protein
VAEQRQHGAGMVGGKAEAIDEQIRAWTERSRKLSLLTSFRPDEPSAGRREIGTHVPGIAPGDIDLPAAREQAASRRLTDQAGSTKNQRARHHRPPTPHMPALRA